MGEEHTSPQDQVYTHTQHKRRYEAQHDPDLVRCAWAGVEWYVRDVRGGRCFRHDDGQWIWLDHLGGLSRSEFQASGPRCERWRFSQTEAEGGQRMRQMATCRCSRRAPGHCCETSRGAFQAGAPLCASRLAGTVKLRRIAGTKGREVDDDLSNNAKASRKVIWSAPSLKWAPKPKP